MNRADIGDGTVASFLALHGHVSISTLAPSAAEVCKNEPFHWNGSELVICSIGSALWSGMQAVPVEVILVAGELQFRFSGTVTTDRIVGVAPEYREQLVWYQGAQRGNAMADSAGLSADSHRLFLTPSWR